MHTAGTKAAEILEDIYNKHKNDASFWTRTPSMIMCDAKDGEWFGGANGECECLGFSGNIIRTKNVDECFISIAEEEIEEEEIPGYAEIIKNLGK